MHQMVLEGVLSLVVRATDGGDGCLVNTGRRLLLLAGVGHGCWEAWRDDVQLV